MLNQRLKVRTGAKSGRRCCWGTAKLTESSFVCGAIVSYAWWRHQMETVSVLLALCVGYSPVTGEFPHKGRWRGALMFFYLRLNKRLSKPWLVISDATALIMTGNCGESWRCPINYRLLWKTRIFVYLNFVFNMRPLQIGSQTLIDFCFPPLNQISFLNMIWISVSNLLWL